MVSKFESYNFPEKLVSIRWHDNRATLSNKNKSFIKKESIFVYEKAIMNRDIALYMRIFGKIRMFFRPWFFRKIFGLSAKF